jgi:hypothetical protein
MPAFGFFVPEKIPVRGSTVTKGLATAAFAWLPVFVVGGLMLIISRHQFFELTDVPPQFRFRVAVFPEI